MIRMLIRLYFAAPNGVRVGVACFVILVGAIAIAVGLLSPPNHEYVAVKGEVVAVERRWIGKNVRCPAR